MHLQKFASGFAATAVTFVIGCSASTGYGHIESLLWPGPDETLPTASTVMAVSSIDVAESPAMLPVQTADLNLSGQYFIFEDTLPNGFHDFDYIEVATHDYVPNSETDSWIPIPPRGFLQTKRNHKFTSVSVSADFVTFETESIKGVHYRFAGKYHHDENQEDFGVIRGRLKKLTMGKVTAEMEVTLVPGGC